MIVFLLKAPVTAGDTVTMRFTLINSPDVLPDRMLLLRVRDGNVESYGNRAGVRGPAVLDAKVFLMRTDACSTPTVPAPSILNPEP